jgi:hypothetical protein
LIVILDVRRPSTRFRLGIYEAPLPKPTGVAITRSPFRKPTAETMPPRLAALSEQCAGFDGGKRARLRHLHPRRHALAELAGHGRAALEHDRHH